MFHAMLPPPPPLFNEAQSQHSQSASEIEATQVTGSQPFQNPFANLWGRLIPAANPRIEIVDLAFDKDEYIFGRAPGYDIYLAGQRISAYPLQSLFLRRRTDRLYPPVPNNRSKALHCQTKLGR
jgi:hypothetical protein